MFPWGILIGILVVGTVVQYVLLRRRRRRDRRRGSGLYREHPDHSPPDRYVNQVKEARLSRDQLPEGVVRCPNCGHENDEDFTYCADCTAELP
ncbi:MAG: hypothetical protein ABEJ08_02280 [Halobacteriaceae archaeon]